MENNMNRGRYYPVNKYKDWLILTEWNSGFSDHIYHKKLTDLIYSSWMSILESVDDKTKSFQELEEFNNMVTEKTGAVLELDNFFTKHIPRDIQIAVIPINKKNHKNLPVFGAGVNSDDKDLILVALNVNVLSTTEKCLIKKNYIKTLAAHETVHIIKQFHNVAQKHIDDFSKDGKLDVSAYLKDKNEIDAYITQINEELRTIHKKYPNMIFLDAIKVSDTYILYKNKIFSYVDKVKNKILSKCLHFWINELNGKVK